MAQPPAVTLPPGAIQQGAALPAVVRHQNQVTTADYLENESMGNNGDHWRYPMASSGQPTTNSGQVPAAPSPVQLAQFTNPGVQQQADQLWSPSGTPPPAGNTYPPPPGAASNAPPPPGGYVPPVETLPPGGPPLVTTPPTVERLPPGSPGPKFQQGAAGRVFPQYAAPYGPFGPTPGVVPEGPPLGNRSLGVPTPLTDIIVNVQEAQTGRFMLGAAVNSNAGLTGQIVLDERNFDWRAIPEGFDDFVNGSAFRGAGQGFRIEALPGNQVQRYMFQFTNPYVMNTRVSSTFSAFLFDRQYVDWNEQRLGGNLGFGYRLTPDLSISAGLRAEEVKILDPLVTGVPELDQVVGVNNELYSGRISLTQDTRDISFQPTQGYFLNLSFEQVFGTYDYSRAEVDFRRYFLMAERPDGSGRHVLGFSTRLGFTGSDTPIFENFFAGGYTTLRGFDFRAASPRDGGVVVGGEFLYISSAEYLFPITADDMLKGVAFVDYGTVEPTVDINWDNYRVAVGLGLRVYIPAMGPAPIALDFAVPIARAETDRIRNFSFFVGVSR